MKREPRVRRAQVLAGIIAGMILGTAHALVTHVVASAAPDAPAVVRAMPDLLASGADVPRR